MITTAIVVLTYFSACNKEDPPAGTYDATITIIEPDDGMILASGDELHVEIDFENDATIYNVEILVLNETSGDTLLYHNENASIANLYQFHEHIMPIVTSVSDCMVKASTWENDKSEAISKSVHVIINP